MSKQTKPIREQCCARLPRGAGRCILQATVGVYRWNPGDTDVDLNKPEAVFCGNHKIDFRRAAYKHPSLRNVRLNLSL